PRPEHVRRKRSRSGLPTSLPTSSRSTRTIWWDSATKGSSTNQETLPTLTKEAKVSISMLISRFRRSTLGPSMLTRSPGANRPTPRLGAYNGSMTMLHHRTPPTSPSSLSTVSTRPHKSAYQSWLSTI
ncbi:hypothetical protein PQX77_008811, partial [Marasmius sp. AFHP31]